MIKAIAETMFVFGIICWIYTIVISFLREYWLTMPLTHLTLWLRTDTFGVLSFIVAVIGFFIWRYHIHSFT